MARRKSKRSNRPSQNHETDLAPTDWMQPRTACACGSRPAGCWLMVYELPPKFFDGGADKIDIYVECPDCGRCYCRKHGRLGYDPQNPAAPGVWDKLPAGTELWEHHAYPMHELVDGTTGRITWDSVDEASAKRVHRERMSRDDDKTSDRVSRISGTLKNKEI